MAVVWESHNTSAWATTSTVTVTKPTGLAVGDLLLGVVCSRKPAGQTISLPAGWTSIYSVTNASNGFTSQRAMYKVADSADVAASNFSFTIASGPADAAGMVARISGYGNINASSSNEINNTTTSPLTTTTITPDRASCLFILTAGGGQSGGASTPALSGYVLTTDNPSWTEQFEITQANAYTFAVATSTRSQTTATGTASITLGTGPANGDYVIGMIAIAPVVSGSGSASDTTANGYVFTPIPTMRVDGTVTTPDTNSRDFPNWTNPDKPSITWTSPDK